MASVPYFYCDCPPCAATVANEFTGSVVRPKESPKLQRNMLLRNTLKAKRKFALRLGELSGVPRFDISKQDLRELLQGNKKVEHLTEKDFILAGMSQKQVDRKIGTGIATLAYQHPVNQTVLIAGDSDFLPVLKLARSAGIDVKPDPTATATKSRRRVKPEMLEQVDGTKTYAGPVSR